MPASPTGYALLVDRYGLRVPLPPRLAFVAERRQRHEGEDVLVLPASHRPADTLAGHLEFALKWEGVDLEVLRALFRTVPAAELAAVVRAKPVGVYTRRLWFLYEWLTGEALDVPDAGKVKSVPAADPRHHHVPASGRSSPRHRVIDNLPGGPAFCPLVRRTAALEALASEGLDERARQVIGRTHADVIARAAAFLLLNDSRASFQIEQEQPSRERAQRWAQAIARAGRTSLSIDELERLQRVVIGDDRFVRVGLRSEGGFVGDHDRRTHEPLPDHVSARPEDLRSLLEGIITYAERATKAGMDPVVAAAVVAFGFVYVHPFEDGNGRLHRWLIHHVLAEARYNPPGMVFPVSAVILRRLDEYSRVLESRSRPLLPFIQWRPTERGNVEVLNDTAPYYRYFDATAHAEFLYRCIEETVEHDLPGEVKYLESYDRFAAGVGAVVDMPARTIYLLHGFLRQNGGGLSQRARAEEFAQLTATEVERVERLFAQCFPELVQP